MQEKEKNFSVTYKGFTVSWTTDLADCLRCKSGLEIRDKVVVFLNSLDSQLGTHKYPVWPEGPEVVGEADVKPDKCPDPSISPPPYDVVEEGYKPSTRKEAVCDQWGHLKCTRCDKVVSSKIPANTMVRAFVECPECVEQDIKEEEAKGKLKCSRCGRIVIRNIPMDIGIMANVVCSECVKKEEDAMGRLTFICSRCQRIIKVIPQGTKDVTAYIVCPACLEREKNKKVPETTVDLKCLRCGRIVFKNIPKSRVETTYVSILCKKCIKKEQDQNYLEKMEGDLDAYIEQRRKDTWTSF